MIATRSVSLRLCFLLLSCVTVLIYSEISQSEAMMMSDEQRYNRALTSTPDQLSTSLEERGAPVAVEEEAGILSRFVSYFKPSYLWKKLASSWIMRFFMPHIYLRHSSDIPAAGNKLFKKARADEATDLFNSAQFQTWSKYFTAAFPDNPKVAADNMVLTLVQYHVDKFVQSIPKTNFADDKLAFGAPFEAALIEYIVNAKKNPETKVVAYQLEESLKSLIKRLNADDMSKSIGERLETGIRGDGISNSKENLVNVVKVQPVQKLSSQEEVIGKPVILLSPILDKQESTAYNLLKKVGLDEVEMDIFNSEKFKQWSEDVAYHFPFDEDEGAGIMLKTLAKLDMVKLLTSISTAKVENGEVPFGNHFKDALIDYIAVAKDTDDFADNLEKALLDLATNLMSGNNRIIGQILEGEVLISRIIKNKKNLVDVFQENNVRTWYSSVFVNGQERASVVLNLRLSQQGITDKQIGEAISKDLDKFTMDAMGGVVLRRLSLLLDNHKMDSVTSINTFLETWFQQALVLNADADLVLPKLRDAFSDNEILSFCTSPELYGDDLKAFVQKMLNVFIHEYDNLSDVDVLNGFDLTSFTLEDPEVRFWMLIMKDRHKEAAGSEMAGIIFPLFSNDISTLIAAGQSNGNSDITSLSKSLKLMLEKSQISS
ncbi:hypothetical protein Plhal304r1_c056g0141521 [Plasmopara halstedii]